MKGSNLVVGILVFLCFFPYPAASAGNNTGVQGIFLVAPFFVIYAAFNVSSLRNLSAFGLIIGVYMFSGAIALSRGVTLLPSNTFKAVPVYSLSALPIIAISPFANRRYLRTILLTVALAILIQGVFGLYQWIAFKRGAFPLSALFVNNSFLLQDNVLLGRPMGLYPEPSAMAANIGPFLMLLIAVKLNLKVSLFRSPIPDYFLLVSTGFGLALLAVSKSGFVLPFGIALVGLIFASVSDRGGRDIFQKAVLYAGFVFFAAAVSYWVWTLAEERFSAELTNAGSWAERRDSIRQAIELWLSDRGTFLFGVGSNQSHLHMEQTGTYQTFGGMVRFGAVYSVIFTYILETGLMGVLAIAGIWAMVCRAIYRSGFILGGVSVFLCWIAAVSVTTSYFMLPGMWLCLGLLLRWDILFERSNQTDMPQSVFEEQSGSVSSEIAFYR